MENFFINTNSPLAEAIARLFRETLLVSSVIFALVTGLVIYCVTRYRARTGRPAPGQIQGHRQLELVWTLGPFLVVIYLFAITVRAMREADPPRPAGQEPDVVVIGHLFWWEVRYPQSGVVTANEIHIPTGRPLLFRLETADVIHDFWVPQLGRKMDLTPDRPNFIWLQADQPGTFQGVCSEFCGVQHAWMRLLVVARPPEEFEVWQQQQRQPVAAPATAAARRGAQLYRQMTCVNCHRFGDVEATVAAGPDLTHVGKRATLGAGIMENTPQNLARWIRQPQAIKPGSFMPNMALTDAQTADLLAYLLAPHE